MGCWLMGLCSSQEAPSERNELPLFRCEAGIGFHECYEGIMSSTLDIASPLEKEGDSVACCRGVYHDNQASPFMSRPTRK